MAEAINHWNKLPEWVTHCCLPDKTRCLAGRHALAKRKLPSSVLELTGWNLMACDILFSRLDALTLLLGLKNQESVKTPRGAEQHWCRDENTCSWQTCQLPWHCPRRLPPHLHFIFLYQNCPVNTAKGSDDHPVPTPRDSLPARSRSSSRPPQAIGCRDTDKVNPEHI